MWIPFLFFWQKKKYYPNVLEPENSLRLKIFQVKINDLTEIKTIPISNLVIRAVVIPSEQEFVVLPLLSKALHNLAR